MITTETANLDDPIHNYSFTARIGDLDVPLMAVTGLIINNMSGRKITLSRVMSPNQPLTLNHWYETCAKKDVVITVQNTIVFTIKGAKPQHLEFSDLDAGANQIMIERLTMSYDSLAATKKAA